MILRVTRILFFIPRIAHPTDCARDPPQCDWKTWADTPPAIEPASALAPPLLFRSDPGGRAGVRWSQFSLGLSTGSMTITLDRSFRGDQLHAELFLHKRGDRGTISCKIASAADFRVMSKSPLMPVL